MADEERERQKEQELERETETRPKLAWHKPTIRASAAFDVQAMACAAPRTGPPFCNGGLS